MKILFTAHLFMPNSFKTNSEFSLKKFGHLDMALRKQGIMMDVPGRSESSVENAYMFCYGFGLLQNLNTTGQSMLGSNPRRPGLRQSTRQLPAAMEVEQALPRSFSKDRMSRNFGTNLANNISRKALLRPEGKVFVKVGKNNGRRIYRKESGEDVQQVALLEPAIRRSETSLYEQSINSVLHHNESSEYSPKDFLSWQSEIDESMRCTLIGWLVDVCNEFQLKNETLFMCASLIDRFLREQNVPKNRFQLLGVSALFIASKYEEIYPPHISKFVCISGGSYTKQDVFEMESQIILRLDFKLISCTALRFLDMRCLQVVELPPQNRTLSEFLLLLALLEYRTCWHKPSTLALAALCFSASIFQNRRVEPQHLGISYDANLSSEEFRQCFTEIYAIYSNRGAGHFNCVRVRLSKNQHFDPNLY